MKDNNNNTEDNITIIEKNLHRTNSQRIKDTLCLFLPIAAAFTGCLLTDPVWNLFIKERTSKAASWPGRV